MNNEYVTEQNGGLLETTTITHSLYTVVVVASHNVNIRQPVQSCFSVGDLADRSRSIALFATRKKYWVCCHFRDSIALEKSDGLAP